MQRLQRSLLGSAASALLLLLTCEKAASLHAEHRSHCTKQRMCNGNLMCADVCVPGTVAVDEWAQSALAYQRSLQRDQRFSTYELPASHNSAIVSVLLLVCLWKRMGLKSDE
jgi:hypothetical protein